MTAPLTSGGPIAAGYTMQWQGGRGASAQAPIVVSDPWALQPNDTQVPSTTPGIPISTPIVTVGGGQPGKPGQTGTDNQIITVGPGDAFGSQPMPPGSSITLFGRSDNLLQNFVQGIVTATTATIAVVVDGVRNVIATAVNLANPATWGNIIMRIGEGIDTAARRTVTLIRDGVELVRGFISGVLEKVGEAFRGWGFGTKTGDQNNPPGSVDNAGGQDNTPTVKWGQLSLTNYGTEDGWPRYLCYGPGTFRIADGPESSNFVEFGPIGDGQIALLTTLPRLRGVVDLSPAQPAQQLTGFQTFLDRLIGLATNQNVPPLLEWFESLFGIRPPQGPFYSLLKGRFTKPIPPKPSGGAPSTARIPVQILNATGASKVVAALTPMRRWPE